LLEQTHERKDSLAISALFRYIYFYFALKDSVTIIIENHFMKYDTHLKLFFSIFFRRVKL
jgi:hypothetical protein